MKGIFGRAASVILLGLLGSAVRPSEGQIMSESGRKDRSPAVAGSFYPDDPFDLRRMVVGLLEAGKKGPLPGLVRALVVPHAGYVFSGGVAASGYNQLDPGHPYRRVFILASSHRVHLDKASVFTGGDYLTPLGRVEVDGEVSAALAKATRYITDDPAAHLQEHSIEVQLPFLQVVLDSPFKIVPIVLATQSPKICKGIAEALKPYFTSENLFIVSADFSHYPSSEDAKKADAATAAAFVSNSPGVFLDGLAKNDRLRIPGLATSMCAWPAGLTLLYLTEGKPALKFSQVDYQNSGDIEPYGDKSRVVGYHAIAVSEGAGGKTVSEPDGRPFELTAADKNALLRIARETVEAAARSRPLPELKSESYGPALQEKAGAFVTLRTGSSLRGCIGTFESENPLFLVIQEMAVASSTRDPRFQPVQAGELKDIRIEISVLTPMRKIEDIGEIQLGKHGILVQQGHRRGTFLPQVATETGWTLEEFLGHCAEDKAGIGWNGWKQADIYIYETLIMEEEKR